MPQIKVVLTNTEFEAFKDRATNGFMWESRKTFDDQLLEIYKGAGLVDPEKIIDIDNPPDHLNFFDIAASMDESIQAFCGDFKEFFSNDTTTHECVFDVPDADTAQNLTFSLLLLVGKHNTLDVLRSDSPQVSAAKNITKAFQQEFPELHTNILY